jgi:thiosulfate reductase cytochrome b subunit
VRLRAPGLHLFFDYRTAVLVHKLTGFVMAASFIFWLIYSIVCGSLRKYYVVRRRDLMGFPAQALYYGFAVFRGGRNPFPGTAEEKFNPLQKFAYLSVMLVFTPLIVVTGILFSDILRFHDVIAFIGGLRILDAVHLIAAYIFLDYLIIHIYMSTMGATPLDHIKEMITGGHGEEPEMGEEREAGEIRTE